MTDDIRAVLEENLEGMRKSVLWLKRCHAKCTWIGVKERYAEDEFDAFENLASLLFGIAEEIERYCRRFAAA